MAGPYDFTGQNIENTYQRVLQTPDGVTFYNGTGSLVTLPSANTSSLLTTASVNLNTITFTKGDGSTFPITVNTGSGGSSTPTFPYTGSAIISGSLTITGSLNAPSITGSLFGTASWAQSASVAISSSYSTTASYALSSSYVLSSSYALSSSYTLSSSFATSASYSLSASYVSPGGNDTYVQFNSNNTFAGDSALTYDSNKQLNTLRLNVIGRLILEGIVTIDNNSSPYTVETDTSVILCDTSAGPIDIDIDSTAVRGRILTIKDIGNASSNNITFGGSTIDGGAFSVINIDKQSIIIIRAPGSGEWYIIGSHN